MREERRKGGREENEGEGEKGRNGESERELYT